MAANAQLPSERRDALTAGPADLLARMTGRRVAYIRRTGLEAYERALRALRLTVTLDALGRDVARGDRQSMMFNRDAALADSVEWFLGRADRIVLAAHNGHIQRWPSAIPGALPATPMGLYLADRLSPDYVVIGTTSGTGQILNVGPDFYTGTLFTAMEPPRPDRLDTLMAASHDGPFATDLRRLSPADADTVRAVVQQRAGIGSYYAEQRSLEAFDVVIHVPHVTAADPDEAALAHFPEKVRRVFAAWNPASA